jgi:hypothetical protein
VPLVVQDLLGTAIVARSSKRESLRTIFGLFFGGTTFGLIFRFCPKVGEAKLEQEVDDESLELGGLGFESRLSFL